MGVAHAVRSWMVLKPSDPGRTYIHTLFIVYRYGFALTHLHRPIGV